MPEDEALNDTAAPAATSRSEMEHSNILQNVGMSSETSVVPEATPVIQPESSMPPVAPSSGVSPPAAPATPIPSERDDFVAKRPGMFTRFMEAITGRKRKRLGKIIMLAETRAREAMSPGVGRTSRPRAITNDDVEKLLRVSDATASRFLAELVRQEKLRRVGSPEHAQYEVVR